MSAADDDRLTGSPSFQTDLAAAWSSDALTRSFSATATGFPADLPFLFSSGQRFGPYLIVRPLGKGGMGQVYEAEESDSGRRVAIKILSRGIGDEEDRERFLGEGRLAAALSHPNSVYVFGTSEVQGLPVIAMELAPGGTLKELVGEKPMAPADAVDATLQVVAGLQAAAGIGILHRDVKPSNCFIDTNGRVVVGDFGLSLATGARGATGSAEASGTIQGTPGYASPEQLRGDALDVRADIYSVGATLFYLLAGRPPFEDPDVRQLISRVATEAAPSLAAIRPDVARGLATVVARCLAKTPAERYRDYAALAAALEPFRTIARTPATLGRRVLAGIVDTYACSLIASPISLYFGVKVVNPSYRSVAILSAGLIVAAQILYYTLAEGVFGAAIGKAVFRLRVAAASSGAPGLRKALLRSAIYLLPSHILNQAAAVILAPQLWQAAQGTARVPVAMLGLVGPLLSLVVTVVLFSTMRRSNGYQALHDRFSGTSVVLKGRVFEARQAPAVAAAARRPVSTAGSRLGPYTVAGDVPTADASRTIEGYDERLQRPVWIEILPAGTPPLPALRRDLSRPARARWLTGRRTTDACWDAYEAIDGRCFEAIIAERQPWSRVRHWLAELAEETAAGLADGSLPRLSTGRLWIAADDRARLLEWVPPGAGTTDSTAGAGPDFPSAQRFLYVTALSALLGRPAKATELPAMPLPLPARTLLMSLKDASFATPQAMAAEAGSLLSTPALLTRGRRAIQLAACAAFPCLVTVFAAGGVLFMQRAANVDSPVMKLSLCLDRIAELNELDKQKGETPQTAAEREALGTYIGTALASTVRDPETWLRSVPSIGVKPGYRDVAERAVAAHRDAAPGQVQAAAVVATELFASEGKELASLRATGALGRITVVSLAGSCAFVACVGLIGAFVARGGFTMRLFGSAVVRRDGREVSRVRTLARGVLAWSPAAIMPIAHVMGLRISMDNPFVAVPSLVGVVILTLGAVWAMTHPSRGLQDRLIGTWLVPR